MKTPPIVIVLRILGGLTLLAGIIYGIGAVSYSVDLAQPNFAQEYALIFDKWTAARQYDATVSVFAFGSSVLVFALASMLVKIWQIEYHLRPEPASSTPPVRG
jgi:hypothetical protein